VPLANALRQQNRMLRYFLGIIFSAVGFYALCFIAGLIIGILRGAMGG
jgi:hypothetical protein